jgi:hypothetical protein
MVWLQVTSAEIRNQDEYNNGRGAFIRRPIVCDTVQRSSLAFAKAKDYRFGKVFELRAPQCRLEKANATGNATDGQFHVGLGAGDG